MCCEQQCVLLRVSADGLQCQPLLLTTRDTAALVSVDPSIVDHRMIDEARSNHLRILAWAARVFEVFDPPETLFVVTERLLSTVSSSHGRFVETPFCIRSLSVLQERLRHVCARLTSQGTSSAL